MTERKDKVKDFIHLYSRQYEVTFTNNQTKESCLDSVAEPIKSNEQVVSSSSLATTRSQVELVKPMNSSKLNTDTKTSIIACKEDCKVLDNSTNKDVYATSSKHKSKKLSIPSNNLVKNSKSAYSNTDKVNNNNNIKEKECLDSSKLHISNTQKIQSLKLKETHGGQVSNSISNVKDHNKHTLSKIKNNIDDRPNSSVCANHRIKPKILTPAKSVTHYNYTDNSDSIVSLQSRNKNSKENENCEDMNKEVAENTQHLKQGHNSNIIKKFKPRVFSRQKQFEQNGGSNFKLKNDQKAKKKNHKLVNNVSNFAKEKKYESQNPDLDVLSTNSKLINVSENKIKDNDDRSNINLASDIEKLNIQKSNTATKNKKPKQPKFEHIDMDVDNFNNSVIIQDLPKFMLTNYKKVLTSAYENYGEITRIGSLEEYTVDGCEKYATTITFQSEEAANRVLEDSNKDMVKKLYPPLESTLVVWFCKWVPAEAWLSAFSEFGRIRQISDAIRGPKNFTYFIVFDSCEASSQALRASKRMKIQNRRIYTARFKLQPKQDVLQEDTTVALPNEEQGESI